MAEESLALLMTDLEASTLGWDRHRQAFRDLIEAYVDLVERRLQPVPRVEGFTGDGHVLSFPTVDAAATAALRLREQWERRRRSFAKPEWETTHRVRAGLHWGRTSRLADGRMIGNAVNLCARVLGAARPDEVLVSETALRELDRRDRYAWGRPRTVPLRGLHDADLLSPGTPLYPLRGLAGLPDAVPLPAESELRRRQVVEDLATELLSVWNTASLEEIIARAATLADLERHAGFNRALLASVLRVAGRLQEAQAQARRAVDSDPGLWRTHAVLGRVLEDQGRPDEALSCYEEARRLNPGDSALIERMEALRSGGRLQDD